MRVVVKKKWRFLWRGFVIGCALRVMCFFLIKKKRPASIFKRLTLFTRKSCFLKWWNVKCWWIVSNSWCVLWACGVRVCESVAPCLIYFQKCWMTQMKKKKGNISFFGRYVSDEFLSITQCSKTLITEEGECLYQSSVAFVVVSVSFLLKLVSFNFTQLCVSSWLSNCGARGSSDLFNRLVCSRTLRSRVCLSAHRRL